MEALGNWLPSSPFSSSISQSADEVTNSNDDEAAADASTEEIGEGWHDVRVCRLLYGCVLRRGFVLLHFLESRRLASLTGLDIAVPTRCEFKKLWLFSSSLCT